MSSAKSLAHSTTCTHLPSTHVASFESYVLNAVGARAPCATSTFNGNHYGMQLSASSRRLCTPRFRWAPMHADSSFRLSSTSSMGWWIFPETLACAEQSVEPLPVAIADCFVANVEPIRSLRSDNEVIIAVPQDRDWRCVEASVEGSHCWSSCILMAGPWSSACETEKSERLRHLVLGMPSSLLRGITATASLFNGRCCTCDSSTFKNRLCCVNVIQYD
jgi:hypothetical protein